MPSLKVIQDYAKDNVGGLSFVSKMPGASWSISAHECKVGGRLAKIPGSVCHNCYALKGNYNRQVVKDAHARRLAHTDDPKWAWHMAAVINSYTDRTGEYSFRWFDSGDLQSWSMLLRIIHVCTMTPKVRHWLPTKEYALIRRLRKMIKKDILDLPENLTIRVSAPMAGQWYPKFYGFSTSVVLPHGATVPRGVSLCPAPSQGGKCLDCRSCWDPDVPVVGYAEH